MGTIVVTPSDRMERHLAVGGGKPLPAQQREA